MVFILCLLHKGLSSKIYKAAIENQKKKANNLITMHKNWTLFTKDIQVAICFIMKMPLNL